MRCYKDGNSPLQCAKTTTTTAKPTTTTAKPITTVKPTTCDVTKSTICSETLLSQGYCVSQYGYCGNSVDHCNSLSLWSSACSSATSKNYCGSAWNILDCGKPCPNGVDSECSGGLKCFADSGICSTTAPTTTAPTAPPSDGGGTTGSITYEMFTLAFTSNGFPAPTLTQFSNFNNNYASRGRISSVREAAMFVAQIIHESGGLRYVEEIACKDTKCPGEYRVAGDNPNLFYYGRGYIQVFFSLLPSLFLKTKLSCLFDFIIKAHLELQLSCCLYVPIWR
jgi:hypothetical protein